jgi:hypothetical protein
MQKSDRREAVKRVESRVRRNLRKKELRNVQRRQEVASAAKGNDRVMAAEHRKNNTEELRCKEGPCAECCRAGVCLSHATVSGTWDVNSMRT